MVLPIREHTVESVRDVRITDIRFDPDKDDRVIYADIDFDLKHNDQDETVDECWAFVEINPTQKDLLVQAGKDWQECKVELGAVSSYGGLMTIGVTKLQIADTWVEPIKVAQKARI